MKLGLHVGNFSWPGSPENIGPVLGEMVKKAETAGFDSFWPMDHFFQIPVFGPPEMAMLESYATLAFIAAQTSTIKLGVLVTGVVYRHPGILAKTVTTLDVLSGGRAWLGMGAAWNERESRALGVPFPPLKERFEQMEEALQICLQMWSDNNGPYNGKHYQLAETLNSPQALSKPHPPILIGGMGEHKTFRMVAQHGDACNLFAFRDDLTEHKLDALRQRCDEVGRNYDEITKTCLLNFSVSKSGANGTMTAQQVIDAVAHQGERGFDQVILILGNQNDPEVFDVFGEDIIPVVSEIVPAGR